MLRYLCSITLEFDQSNALARRKLAALLATRLFLKVDEAAVQGGRDGMILTPPTTT